MIFSHKNFHKQLILQAQHTSCYHFNYYIPKEWQLILMNDGSLTQSLTSLTGELANLKVVEEYSYKLIDNIRKTRQVWLEDYKSNKLALAESLWPSPKKNQLSNHKPIGQSFIEYQFDIYKDIHEIYYGYCSYLENIFNCQGPIWGRKYTIYYQKKRLATLREIFAPEVIDFFSIQRENNIKFTEVNKEYV
uniref:hypothetical protein n=1 Tax=Catenella fusiformis TaxID=3024791 RepID=UPI0027DA31A1|nr:hypothetical protein REQ04_pgp156 [Catenella fusiformis]WCH57471.1 hypothetical protein [Catenella fusiformis]